MAASINGVAPLRGGARALGSAPLASNTLATSGLSLLTALWSAVRFDLSLWFGSAFPSSRRILAISAVGAVNSSSLGSALPSVTTILTTSAWPLSMAT